MFQTVHIRCIVNCTKFQLLAVACKPVMRITTKVVELCFLTFCVFLQCSCIKEGLKVYKKFFDNNFVANAARNNIIQKLYGKKIKAPTKDNGDQISCKKMQKLCFLCIFLIGSRKIFFRVQMSVYSDNRRKNI